MQWEKCRRFILNVEIDVGKTNAITNAAEKRLEIIEKMFDKDNISFISRIALIS